MAAGRGRGRYRCPIEGRVVTLGQTGVQLDRPMRLVWQSGGFGRWHLTEPGEFDARRLERVAGRVLGPGCVVSDYYAPDRARPAGWDKAAGLRLVDATEPGDRTDWLVNEPLVYRRCVACDGRVPDLPEHHVPTEWTPRRTEAMRGRSRHTRTWVPVDQGPHPADSLACPDCDPRRT
ncbi:hypothetical protein [Streptomyces sp. 7N604]|uniref:hypothetical protein n=1 Tax=Streptomyces sp. 7N604 TaxID=3457415 RepID=UPI003FD107C9